MLLTDPFMVLEAVAGDGLHALPMDVSDEASVVDGVAQAVAARGPVQICVANAGIAEGRAFLKTSLEEWRQMMAINLDGAFLSAKYAAPKSASVCPLSSLRRISSSTDSTAVVSNMQPASRICVISSG